MNFKETQPGFGGTLPKTPESKIPNRITADQISKKIGETSPGDNNPDDELVDMNNDKTPDELAAEILIPVDEEEGEKNVGSPDEDLDPILSEEKAKIKAEKEEAEERIRKAYKKMPKLT